MNRRTGVCKRFMLTLSLVAMALVVLGLPRAAFASGGVDDPNGVFQLEGNATTDPGVCYQVTASGPLLAPGFPNCPAGFTAVTFGPQTEDWDKIFAAVTASG